MNKILDNISEIKKLDSKNMLGSIQLLGEQIKEVWAIGEKFKLPADCKKVNRLVIAGMGGSSLCAHILSELLKSDLKVPVELVRDYHLPEYVDSKTLVIASSYSGGTEEAINAGREAKKRKAKVLVIAMGGELAAWAEENNIPVLTFSANNNPCGSPRMGLGYMIFGHAILWAKAGLIKFGETELKLVLDAVARFNLDFGTTAVGDINFAKTLASKTLGRSVWFVGARHLIGSAHAAANQMNENAKRFAGYFLIPELNHHLLEGMMNPKNNADNLLFVFLQSALYDAKINKRYEITKQIMDKCHVPHLTYQCQTADKLSQVCEVLVLSSYVSYYSAILQGIDPTAIPYVDYFKEQLKKK